MIGFTKNNYVHELCCDLIISRCGNYFGEFSLLNHFGHIQKIKLLSLCAKDTENVLSTTDYK